MLEREKAYKNAVFFSKWIKFYCNNFWCHQEIVSDIFADFLL